MHPAYRNPQLAISHSVQETFNVENENRDYALFRLLNIIYKIGIAKQGLY